MDWFVNRKIKLKSIRLKDSETCSNFNYKLDLSKVSSLDIDGMLERLPQFSVSHFVQIFNACRQLRSLDICTIKCFTRDAVQQLNSDIISQLKTVILCGCPYDSTLLFISHCTLLQSFWLNGSGSSLNEEALISVLKQNRSLVTLNTDYETHYLYQ
jgi:hypothetical protein